LTFWVNPFDSDWFHGIYAGRFLTYTDAARWDLGVRIGFLKHAIRNQWVTITGGQKLIYKRPVRIFRRFQITYQITGWDDKWMYVAHVFKQQGEIKALVLTKLGLRSKGKLTNPHDVFALLGHGGRRPPPQWICEEFKRDLEVLNLAEL
jgi:acyl-CoA thioesterase FadM